MKNNKQNSLAGLLLIIIGLAICFTVGLPFLSSVFAIVCGLYLIHYGLQLRGQPGLSSIAQRIIREIHSRFF